MCPKSALIRHNSKLYKECTRCPRFHFFPALTLAHLFFCASEIRLRPAADILLRACFVFPPAPSSSRT